VAVERVKSGALVPVVIMVRKGEEEIMKDEGLRVNYE
jgi:hypothetical protein